MVFEKKHLTFFANCRMVFIDAGFFGEENIFTGVGVMLTNDTLNNATHWIDGRVRLAAFP